jgi:virginiamycin B lyase
MAPLKAHLVKTYPVKGRPDAVIVNGPLKVSMKAWPVPTPGSRPHDPLAAKDGSLWYTGQMTSALGRVDPKTGAVKEFPLKTEHAGPHGLTEDKAGNIWYTGNHAAHIGKLNPKTGEVTEYKMPEADAKDPHTLLFDKTGNTLWFTVQNANRIGRLDPKTGEVKLFTPPTPKSRPYAWRSTRRTTSTSSSSAPTAWHASTPRPTRSRSMCCPMPRRVRDVWRLPPTTWSGTPTIRVAISAA